MKNLYDNYFDLRNVGKPSIKERWMPRWLEPFLPENKESNILDIGCGFGLFMTTMEEKGYSRLTGVDISKSAVELCNKRNMNVSLIENIIDYTDKYTGEKFDFILLSHVLEHIKKDVVIQTLESIRTKLLVPAGKIIIAVPNAQANTGAYWAYEDFTHETLYTSGSLLFILKAAGFKKIDFLDVEGIAGLPRLERLKRKFFLKIYRRNFAFWNKITRSAFHAPSPCIFTYELKVIVK